MNNTKFYICRHCGNLVATIHNAGVPVFCCGQKLEELVPNTVEASGEKHIPAVTVEGSVVTVNVGSVDHPMVDEHYIEWVYVKTEKGGQRKNLKPGEAPNVTFYLGEDKAIAVYAYCNLHGLWMAELN
ncbi:MAG: desulfoferrodoxin [Oscillospiraceae bacterium]|nr:desulfoferrodoxin [Oscillospiraceae bacterium]